MIYCLKHVEMQKITKPTLTEAFLLVSLYFLNYKRVVICNNQLQHSQQHCTRENNTGRHVFLFSVYLFSCLQFPKAVQEVTLDDRANNGQALSCLQLWGKGEQSGIFYMEVFIQLQQHQQLRPGYRKSKTDNGDNIKRRSFYRWRMRTNDCFILISY